MDNKDREDNIEKVDENDSDEFIEDKKDEEVESFGLDDYDDENEECEELEINEEVFKENNNYYNNNDHYRELYYKPKKKRSVFPFLLTALISALIGGLISSYIAPAYLYGKLLPTPEIFKERIVEVPSPQNIQIAPTENITNVTAVAKKTMKSVVGITTISEGRDWFYRPVETQGVGSGLIVHKDGFILTNSHVISDGNAKTIVVQFEDGTKKEAKVLWFEPTLDLAIVKVEGTNYSVMELGDSDNIQVGELAVAIGNPLGLQFQRTVTSGIISGLNRTISDENMELENLIQTDASINPGNSGGPLLNSEGKVIGVNTAKITSAEGLGFSIPINVVKPMIDQVIREGVVKTVYMGIRGMNLDYFEKETGIDLKSEKGIVILEVVENTPASEAGIKLQDILLSIDNNEVSDMLALKKVLYNYKPGDKATITILRDGEKIRLGITFKQTPPNY